MKLTIRMLTQFMVKDLYGNSYTNLQFRKFQIISHPVAKHRWAQILAIKCSNSKPLPMCVCIP